MVCMPSKPLARAKAWCGCPPNVARTPSHGIARNHAGAGVAPTMCESELRRWGRDRERCCTNDRDSGWCDLDGAVRQRPRADQELGVALSGV
eukprot:363614-Chlamydomonas_euryale.AAC.2